MGEGVEREAGEAARGHYVCAEDGDGLGAVAEGVEEGEFEVLRVGEAGEESLGVGGAVEGEVCCWRWWGRGGSGGGRWGDAARRGDL